MKQIKKILFSLLFFPLSLLTNQPYYTINSGVNTPSHSPQIRISIRNTPSLSQKIYAEQKADIEQQLLDYYQNNYPELYHDYNRRLEDYNHRLENQLYHSKKTVLSCNSENLLDRVESRLSLLDYMSQLPNPYRSNFDEGVHELLGKYFHSDGKLRYPEKDETFGYSMQSFFANNFDADTAKKLFKEAGDKASRKILKAQTGFFEWFGVMFDNCFPAKSLNCSYKQIREHPYNQQLKRLIDACKREDFSTAQKEINPSDRLMNLLYTQAYTVWRARTFNQYGIKKEYEVDPAWHDIPLEDKQDIAQSIDEQKAYNQYFQQRSEKRKNIKTALPSAPSEIIEDLVDHYDLFERRSIDWVNYCAYHAEQNPELAHVFFRDNAPIHEQKLEQYFSALEKEFDKKLPKTKYSIPLFYDCIRELDAENAEYLYQIEREDLLDLVEQYDAFAQESPRFADRLNAIDQLLDDEVRSFVTFELSPEAEQALTKQEIGTQQFRHITGNPFQQQIHKELVSIVNTTARIQINTHNKTALQLTDTIYRSANLASEYNHSNFMRKAAQLTDICWSFLRGAERIAQGIYKGFDNYCDDLIDHPIETLARPLIGNFMLAYNIGSFIADITGTRIGAALGNPHAQEHWQEMHTSISHLYEGIKVYLETVDAGDFLEQSATFATEMALDCAALSLFNSLFKKAGSSAGKMLEKLNQLPPDSGSFPHNALIGITPEGYPVAVAHQTAQVAAGQELPSWFAKAAETTGKPNIVNAIARNCTDKISDQKIVERIEKADKNFNKLIKKNEVKIIEKIKKIMHEKGLYHPWLHSPQIKGNFFEHLLIGNNTSGKPSGFHSTIIKQDKTIKVLKCSPRKTWIGKWFKNKKKKTSSFFPNSWDELKIGDKVVEALCNTEEVILKEGGIKILGQTSEKIVLEVFINNKGLVERAYPAIRYKGKLCIP